MDAVQIKNQLNDYLQSNFSSDLKAGFITAIVALPLAIAFAIASGVEPIMGLYTAIIAGVLGSLFGGSTYSITGPTGAMTVVILSAVHKFGIEGLLLAGLNVYQAYKYTKIVPFKKEMVKIFLLSMIPTLLIFFLRKTVPLTHTNIILLGLSFIASYFILLIIAKCFDKNDIMIINAIRKKIIGQ